MSKYNRHLKDEYILEAQKKFYCNQNSTTLCLCVYFVIMIKGHSGAGQQVIRDFWRQLDIPDEHTY